MIKNTFVFLERISTKKEESIWKQGIKDWNDFLHAKKVKGISPKIKLYYDRRIREAQHALLENNSSYFLGKLPSVEMWRLYHYFREEEGFLDIEVDSYGKIVLVGISNYYDSHFFVRGANLDNNLITKELSKYKMIITFNGSSFDLPKLRKQLGVDVIIPHLDLKPLCVNLGLKGGLKQVEKELHLNRPKHLYGNPVDLWKAFHASGDRDYLALLIEYNKEDIENLKGVVEWCYRDRSGKVYKQLNYYSDPCS
ncbi:ribonuclease H-like domain-containing protein [Candidatus Woesearchaeota archaeon]|nr:ribonuclease H-like domain-containing protein [Candidatus Woesearchaeota archaeon]